MAAVFRKVGLASRSREEDMERNGSMVPCARVCDLVSVCTRPGATTNRPTQRRRQHMTLLQSLQVRLDLWTTTTGHFIDRRFCSRRSVNELYRSNSFRFEKFDRVDDEAQQVSLCDDYSLPVDFVNKRKAQTLDWRKTPTRTTKVEVIDEYFDPRDTKTFGDDKLYTTGGENAQFKPSNHLKAKRNVSVTIVRPESDNEEERIEIIERLDRRPSPYYYSDLLNHDDSGPSAFKSYHKSERTRAASRSENKIGLDEYHPFSAKENLEPKQGGLEFYDFAAGKVSRKKHRVVVEVKNNLEKPKKVETGARRKEYGKSVSVDVSSLNRNSSKRKNCKKSASLDIPLEAHDFGDSANRFRPIVPVKETEEGVEGGDEEEEVDHRERRKSLRRSFLNSQRDCLTGAPRSVQHDFGKDFSPAQLLQHVIAKGGESKSLLATCLAEWDAHAKLMRPLTTRALAECSPQCVSSEDDDNNYYYSREPFPDRLNITRGEFLRSQESLRSKELLKEPIPEGRYLGDEFIKGQKVDEKVDEGGFEEWRTVAKEIIKETENWDNRHSCDSLNDLDEMTRRGLLYETAFDSKVSKSDDDLDDLDLVTNHPVLHSRMGRSKSAVPTSCSQGTSQASRPGSSLSRRKSNFSTSPIEAVTSDVEHLEITKNPTPPATEPLPVKFSGHEALMNPGSPIRLKDTKLPIKSLKARASKPPQESVNSEVILEVKDRPMKEIRKLRLPNRPKKLLADLKPRRFKFSSTESMATSSSGSLESIKSSTSEGNRSTSSSGSHRSSSISSHSSDSVGNVLGTITVTNLQFHLQQTNPSHGQPPNMIHILSPISDKSSVEPTEICVAKNNNSPKTSPEEKEAKPKRRNFPNSNLINLGLQVGGEAGSDSGISTDSRTQQLSTVQNETEFSDLPFDMPKLRRRRNELASATDACTSGSATSVDLRDLPFDMPKLRRKLRPSLPTDSHTSSSQSIASQPSAKADLMLRPAMTLSLNLDSNSAAKKGLNLDLNRGRMTLGMFSGADLIDATQPLDKQSWYHGSITRIEAEGILRSLKEGSYLVRNSESSKQDYSLSLKSARGFMHMKIQKDPATQQFILGQFSKPFNSIPDMIKHYSINRLPIRGAEHMCLLKPVPAQLL